MKLQRSTFFRIAGFYCAAMLPLAALGQADKNQLAVCYAVTNINEKVACYDKLAHPGQDASAPVSQSGAPTVVTPVAAANRVEPAATANIQAPVRAEPVLAGIENFGQQASSEADVDDEEAQVGTVAAINDMEPNKLQITLSNGQVWKQSIGKSFLLRENDTVRITPSPWGRSFRLAREGKPGFIQVLRLR